MIFLNFLWPLLATGILAKEEDRVVEIRLHSLGKEQTVWFIHKVYTTITILILLYKYHCYIIDDYDLYL